MGYDTLHAPVLVNGDIQSVPGAPGSAFVDYELDYNDYRPDLCAMIEHDGDLWIAHVDYDVDSGYATGPYVERYNPAADTWTNVGGAVEAVAPAASLEGDRVAPARVALASDGTDVFLAYTINVYHDGGEGDFGVHLYWHVVIRKWTGSEWELLLDKQANGQSRGATLGDSLGTVKIAARAGVAHLLVSREDLETGEVGLRYLSTADADDILPQLGFSSSEFSYFDIKADTDDVFAFYVTNFDVDHWASVVMVNCATLAIQREFVTRGASSALHLAISQPYWDDERWIYYHLLQPGDSVAGLFQIPIDGSGDWEELDGDAAYTDPTVDNGRGFDNAAGLYASIMPEASNVWCSWVSGYNGNGRAYFDAVRCEDFDRHCPLVDPPKRWRMATPLDTTLASDAPLSIPPASAFSGLRVFNNVPCPAPSILIDDAIYTLVYSTPETNLLEARLQLWRWDICRGCGSCGPGRGLHIWQRV